MSKYNVNKFEQDCADSDFGSLLEKLKDREMLNDLESFDISPSQWRNAVYKILSNKYFTLIGKCSSVQQDLQSSQSRWAKKFQELQNERAKQEDEK